MYELLGMVGFEHIVARDGKRHKEVYTSANSYQ